MFTCNRMFICNRKQYMTSPNLLFSDTKCPTNIFFSACLSAPQDIRARHISVHSFHEHQIRSHVRAAECTDIREHLLPSVGNNNSPHYPVICLTQMNSECTISPFFSRSKQNAGRTSNASSSNQCPSEELFPFKDLSTKTRTSSIRVRFGITSAYFRAVNT